MPCAQCSIRGSSRQFVQGNTPPPLSIKDSAPLMRFFLFPPGAQCTYFLPGAFSSSLHSLQESTPPTTVPLIPPLRLLRTTPLSQLAMRSCISLLPAIFRSKSSRPRLFAFCSPKPASQLLRF
ncbi:unnamed protein product [Mortierella alpina]